MTKKEQPKVRRQIQNPEGYPQGTVIDEFWDGSKETTHPDGTKEFIDAHGKSLAKLTITETQIEAWKKMPKEEGTKRILELISNNTLDVSEKRFILDAIWKLIELHGATIPTTHTQNIVAIKISVADLPPGMKIIDTSAIQKG